MFGVGALELLVLSSGLAGPLVAGIYLGSRLSSRRRTPGQ